METSDIAGSRTAIAVCEFDAPAQLSPQNDQLMSEHGIFGLKSQRIDLLP
jgi:hypothetical protein